MEYKEREREKERGRTRNGRNRKSSQNRIDDYLDYDDGSGDQCPLSLHV